MAFLAAAIPIAQQMHSMRTGHQGQSQGDGNEASSPGHLQNYETDPNLIVRGPPPAESVNMVKYIIIAVIIIAILLIYFGLGRKWEEAPKYQSVFDKFTPDRIVLPERKPHDDMVSNSTRVYGIMPRQPIKNMYMK